MVKWSKMLTFSWRKCCRLIIHKMMIILIFNFWFLIFNRNSWQALQKKYLMQSCAWENWIKLLRQCIKWFAEQGCTEAAAARNTTPSLSFPPQSCCCMRIFIFFSKLIVLIVVFNLSLFFVAETVGPARPGHLPGGLHPRPPPRLNPSPPPQAA